MNEGIRIEVKTKSNGVKVKAKEVGEKELNRKRKMRNNGIKCGNELKEFLKFQSGAVIHLFKFLLFSLAWLGDMFLLVGDNMNKKEKDSKGGKSGLF